MMAKYDTKDQKKTLNALYPTLEKISIDYAIMEKVNPKEIRIIKTKNLKWSDVGTWETVWQFVSEKAGKNKHHLDCKNSIIYSENNKKIIAIGIEDLVIIDTKDGLLICKKTEAKRIKELQHYL